MVIKQTCEIGLGCSIQDYITNPAYQVLGVVNLENLQFPGYLESDFGDDLRYLQAHLSQKYILDGPYIDLNLGSPEPSARRLAIDKTLQAIEFAKACQAKEIVFLSTYLPFIGMGFYERGWIEESIRSWKLITQSEKEIRISLCNTFEYNPTNLIEIVRTIQSPNLGLAFDAGHCLVWGKISLVDWYTQIKEQCRVIYLHSNKGQADEHLSIREGKLAEPGLLQSLLAQLNQSSVLILKYFDKETILEDIKYLQSGIC